MVEQFPLKNIPHTLTHISGFKVFASLDLMNAFHQIPISEEASYIMSLITPWGQVRPLFLPEGISHPAVMDLPHRGYSTSSR